METINNYEKYELFNDLPRCLTLQKLLYEVKVPGGLTESIGLYAFKNRMKDMYNIKDEEKQLDLTLNYLYPLLKEGKIVLKLTKKICGEGIIYNKKENASEAIKEIKKRWLEFGDDIKNRNDFEEFCVQFKLPGGGFIY